jgi:hypothetical protein
MRPNTDSDDPSLSASLGVDAGVCLTIASLLPSSIPSPHPIRASILHSCGLNFGHPQGRVAIHNLLGTTATASIAPLIHGDVANSIRSDE